MKVFAAIMRVIAKVICIIIIDFLTLQKIVECYEMEMSIKVCWAVILFLVLFLAALWLGNNKKEAEDISFTVFKSIVLIILIFGCIIGTVQLQRTGNSEFEAAAAYIGYKFPFLVGVSDSESRLHVLEESVQRSPNNALYNIEYAYKMLELKKYDEAEKYANIVLTNIDPDNADGHAIRGISYFYGYEGTELEDEYDKLAFNDLKTAIDNGNKTIQTLYCYGWLCYDKQMYREAEDIFEKAIGRIIMLPDQHAYPNICSNTYYWYANARYVNVGEYDYEQEQALEKAIQIRPRANFYIQLGQAYYQHNTDEYYSKARDCFDYAVQLSPNIYTHERRGWFYSTILFMNNEAAEDYQYIIDYYQNNNLPDDETIKQARLFTESLTSEE